MKYDGRGFYYVSQGDYVALLMVFSKEQIFNSDGTPIYDKHEFIGPFIEAESEELESLTFVKNTKELESDMEFLDIQWYGFNSKVDYDD